MNSERSGIRSRKESVTPSPKDLLLAPSYLLRQNLLSDAGILVGSYEILCREDGTTVIKLSAAAGSSLSNSKP
jgi:hypothetical protein